MHLNCSCAGTDRGIASRHNKLECADPVHQLAQTPGKVDTGRPAGMIGSMNYMVCAQLGGVAMPHVKLSAKAP